MLLSHWGWRLRHSLDIGSLVCKLIHFTFALDSRDDVFPLNFLFCALLAAPARWIQPVDKLINLSGLMDLSFRSIMIIPILVVIELSLILAESRLANHIVAPELSTKATWPIAIEHAPIAEMDVTVSSRTICLSSRYVLRTTK